MIQIYYLKTRKFLICCAFKLKINRYLKFSFHYFKFCSFLSILNTYILETNKIDKKFQEFKLCVSVKFICWTIILYELFKWTKNNILTLFFERRSSRARMSSALRKLSESETNSQKGLLFCTFSRLSNLVRNR